MNKIIIYTLLFLSLFVNRQSAKAQVAWDFTSGLDGWTMTHSLKGVDSIGNLNITITGADPYMISPNNLAMDAATNKTLKINCRNATNQTTFQLYFITSTDLVWGTNGKMVNINVDPNSPIFKEYIFDFTNFAAWQGTITQLRLDPGNPATGSELSFDYIHFTTDAYTLTLNNGTLKVCTDLLRGGAISYLSRSYENYNIVNTSDNGRYIQQSYYAGQTLNRVSQGQSKSWSPWNWNPVQAGDVYKHSSIVLASSQTDTTIYTKVQPLLWDMNNELSQSYMEMWLSLRGNNIHVQNKLTCFRTDNTWLSLARNQELPAVYVIGDLYNLYTYTGTKPWTSQAADTIKNAGPPWRYWTSPEKWAAFLNTSNWGLGVYNSGTTNFVGGFNGTFGGSSSTSSTEYIAPISIATLNKTSVYSYNYDLIVGTLDQIRSFVYTENNKILPVTFTGFNVKQAANYNTLTWNYEGGNEAVDFEIQESKDGIEFNTIGTISYLPLKTTYTFTDNAIVSGHSYYRIKCVDNTGNSTFSNIVSVIENTSISPVLDFSENGIAKFTMNKKFSGEIRLFDISGQLIQAKSIGETAPVSEFILNYKTKGYYILNLIDNQNINKSLKLFLN